MSLTYCCVLQIVVMKRLQVTGIKWVEVCLGMNT